MAFGRIFTHATSILLLLEISALLLPGEEAPQVVAGVPQQVRHAVRLLPLPRLRHVFPVQGLDGHGVREGVALERRAIAGNIAISNNLRGLKSQCT